MTDETENAMPARLFIAAQVPKKAEDVLIDAVSEYGDYIEKNIPPQNWHVTLVWLGSVSNYRQYLTAVRSELSQSFLPTLKITHVGRGLKKNQLWAHIYRTTNLNNVRQALIERLKDVNFPLPSDIDRDFYPHINLAHLKKQSMDDFLADHPADAIWTIREAVIYRSVQSKDGVQYKEEAVIPFIN